MVDSTRDNVVDISTYFDLTVYSTNDFIELIHGEVFVNMPPIPKHQDIVRELIIFLGLLARKIGGKLYASPIEVVFDEHNVYEPDVLYIAPNGKCEVGEKRLTGAPDLVVEVLSPSTAKRDRQAKYQTYEKYGVREYWIVDPAHDTLEVWTLSEEKVFVRQGVYAGTDSFVSSVLAENITVTDIFRS